MKRVIVLSVVFLFLSILRASAQPALMAHAKKYEIFETDEYNIRFPGPIQKSTQTLTSKVGDLLMSIASYEPTQFLGDSNYVYMTIETRYPDSAMHSDSTDKHEIFFRGAIDGTLRNGIGKLISEVSDSIGKYPSRTVEIDFQNGMAVVRMRMVLRESKMIILQTITSPEKYPNTSMDDFFGSFRLK